MVLVLVFCLSCGGETNAHKMCINVHRKGVGLTHCSEGRRESAVNFDNVLKRNKLHG